VGFTLGDSRQIILPRMTGKQSVALAGIGCISQDYRQQGLFSRLAIASILASSNIMLDQPFLFCGRMAHAITYRTLANSSSNIVPSAHNSITDWHKEVLDCVASLYEVTLMPGSAVVAGSGAPIGYPRLSFEMKDEETALFSAVNRTKGDSLLAISWMPTAPEGW
jgi:hypothetical protein